jgi:DNA processing protein
MGQVEAEGRGGGCFWWAALGQVEGLGAAAMLRLARLFGSPEAACAASLEELVGRGRLSRRQAEQVRALPASRPELSATLEAYAQSGLHLLCLDDADYPAPLLDLRSPPPVLYLLGELLPRDSHAVAIVGTREPDEEGTRLAHYLGRELAQRGFTIVSGLARGIDTAGHRGALEAEQGRSLAILGSGLQRIYPPENAPLAAQLAARGAVLAEVPPETRVDRRLLLARDRIQAALSLAVIVVQGHRQCGSMVTARHAAQCHRLLYGVPWTDSPFAGGWERLRELGARPLTMETDLDALAQEIEAGPPAGRQPSLGASAGEHGRDDDEPEADEE